MGIRYNNTSPLIIDGAFEDFVAGLCTPDFHLSPSSDSSIPIRFYQLFEYGKFVVLQPSGSPSLSLPSNVVKVWTVEKGNDIFNITTDKGDKYTTTFALSSGTFFFFFYHSILLLIVFVFFY